MEITNPNEKKLANLKPFQKGQVGNPNGRPKGSRNKLGEAFLKALHDDFEKHGVKAIVAARTESPTQYIKTIASILPSEMNLNVRKDEELTDDELRNRIAQLATVLGIAAGSGLGAFAAAGTGTDPKDTPVTH